MPYDKNISPVGWYVGSYLLRFVELRDRRRNDPEKRFLSWENTVLVKARTIDEAYRKVEKIAKESSRPYKGGPDAVAVQWEFLGVTDVLPIYEKIADGAEISWARRAPRKLRSLKAMVLSKAAVRQ